MIPVRTATYVKKCLLMKTITDIKDLKIDNSIVTLGKFDGNHIGHRLLFDTVINNKNAGDNAVVFTFSIPPALIIDDKGTEDHRTIKTREEKKNDHFPDGIDYIVEFPFNDETRGMSPEVFVKDILVDKLNVKLIVVGEDFRFGKDRTGDVDTLKKLGEMYGFDVIAVEKVRYKLRETGAYEEVSSSLIKKELQKGNIEEANAMLGSAFTMTSTVVHGKSLGRRIGFPTINFIAPDDKILPPNGVYATKTTVDGHTFNSITNIGCRPTFDDGQERTVETNIFDFNRDIYSKKVSVQFYKRIRPERQFSSTDELVKEINKNIEEVKDYFNNCDE